MRAIRAVLVLGSLVAAAPAAAQAIASAYTRHDYEKCPLVRDDDPVFVRRCVGYADIPVTWTNEPDSSSIEIGTDGVIDGTYDERFTFAVAENTIEWRGPRRAGRIEPFAAIVRFQLCRSVSGPCKPELVLFRLEGKQRSCIAASVDGGRKDANARARVLADTFVRKFQCEKDKSRPPE